ncbi:FKBP-type peptidyl prolyl cis-trans isomerase /apo-metallochaperone SlyD [Tahibacter aquaticus]|uniref:Peptidyl-prolyl cis-trans isomerase n=1 Tax=Tahibacter aquaticus TaxID=520092 RepID=A0A4R6YMV6_9GAMM|nr:peptidylprolyl isomerase [Tahibacter aquaticus]TDR38743.1 FKBP-type peptidyl prolyl cis-trans isomerase /apo-metallochaperone SlyD [Tahibacter aquaticus]
MIAENNKVVSFHYTVTGEDGETVDSSRVRAEPLSILLGHGNIIPGLEKALQGKSAGDKFETEVACDEAYGPRNQEAQQRVPKKYFAGAQKLKVGDVTVLSLKQGGQRMVTVVKVGMTTIDVDLNHPLAGQNLKFDVEVVGVRDAEEVELQHRHAHGAGGHEHA